MNAEEGGGFFRRSTVSPGNEAALGSLFDGLVVGDERAFPADVSFRQIELSQTAGRAMIVGEAGMDFVAHSVQQMFKEPPHLPIGCVDQLGHRKFAGPVHGDNEMALAFHSSG